MPLGAEHQVDNYERWESQRLSALQKFDVLDSPREEAFDRITRLIKSIFSVQIGIVSMIDGHRQWYKSVDGLASTEVPRRETFCRFPLASGQPLIVNDATLDDRFASNPKVTGAPGIRFYAGVPLRTKDGDIIGTVCAIDDAPREFGPKEIRILEDLAQMAMGELELRQRATSDGLTGVLTRRAFKEEATRAVSLATRHATPLSCIAMDLDKFKSINDRHGQAAGDKVLVDVTRTCVALLRHSDLIGRLGGEEFGILLPHTDLGNAMEVAEKLRNAIAGLVFNFNGRVVTATASFGICEFHQMMDFESMLDRADVALYEAKSGGRNRCVASGLTVEPSQPKRRVLKAGSIIFNGRGSVVDCTVKAISDTGARLEVSSTVGIPSTFRLAIASDRFERGCRIVVQTAQSIEVSFSGT